MNTPANVQTGMTPVQVFNKAINSAGIAKRIGALYTPKQAGRFKTTLTQIVTSSPDLLSCNPLSTIGAGMKAAALGLDLSPVFGYACIIPYKGKKGCTAQFQLMVNGWIQLAYRSGMYDYINADAVYEDEYNGFDMISGKVHIEPVEGGYRDQGRKDKIIGYFAAFRLLSGSEKIIYWTIRQIEIHARTYSPSYRSSHPLPIPENWKGPNLYSTGLGWESGWHAMALKTVLKQLLRKWGPLSTDMQEAIEADETAYDENGEVTEPEYTSIADEALPEYSQPDARETPENAPDGESGETIPSEGDEAAIRNLFASGAEN